MQQQQCKMRPPGPRRRATARGQRGGRRKRANGIRRPALTAGGASEQRHERPGKRLDVSGGRMRRARVGLDATAKQQDRQRLRVQDAADDADGPRDERAAAAARR